MKFFNLLFCFIFCTSCTTTNNNQQKTPPPLEFVNLQYLIDDTSPLSQKEITQKFKQNKGIPIESQILNEGFINSAVWIYFELHNSTSKNKEQLVLLDYVHLGNIHFFDLDSGQEYVSGNQIAFNNRSIKNRSNIFPVFIEGNKKNSYLIKCDKSGSLRVPIRLVSKENYYKEEKLHNLSFGIYTGVLLIFIVFCLIIFCVSRKKIHLYYFIYLLCLLSYQWINSGLASELICPSCDFMNTLRGYFSVLIYFTFLQFSQHFLDIKKLSPKINKGVNAIKYSFLALAIISSIFFDFAKTNPQIFLVLSYFLSFASIIAFFLFSVFYYKEKKTSILYFWTAFGTLIVIFIYYLMIEFSILNNPFSLELFVLASGVEAFILMLALGYQYKQTINKKIKLDKELAIQKELRLSAFIKGEEKERKRLSEELHDSVGSKLTQVSRLLQNKEFNLQAIKNKVAEITKETREISHNLMPGYVKLMSFSNSLEAYIEENKEGFSMEIAFRVFDEPKHVDQQIKIQLFRILQEIITNTEKHAEASTLLIALFGYDTSLVLSFQDDGKGFLPNEHKTEGIGIKNILSRINSINGKITFDSVLGEGTNILIEVPF